MTSWEGKVAFVTGGASGIGLGMAEAFAKAGLEVTIADIEGAALARAQSALAAKGLEVQTTTLDVRNLAAFQAAADELVAKAGAVDLVCNNAGVVCETGIGEWTDAGWRWLLDVNVMGTVHGCMAFRPHLERKGRGHIVNTASVTGLLSRGGIGQYGASKFAIVGLSQALREELRAAGVSVHALCPGQWPATSRTLPATPRATWSSAWPHRR